MEMGVPMADNRESSIVNREWLPEYRQVAIN